MGKPICQILYGVVIVLAIVIIHFPQENLACIGTTRKYYIAEVTTPEVITTATRRRRSTTTPEYYDETDYYSDDESTTAQPRSRSRRARTTTTTPRPQPRRTTTPHEPEPSTEAKPESGKYKCGTIPQFGNTIDVSQARAARYEIPWQVRIAVDTVSGERRTCGGALIVNNNTVITTASCVADADGPASITVFAGELNRNRPNEPGEQQAGVGRIFKHRLYTPGSLEYDIALLKIDEVQISEAVVPACFPSPCRPATESDSCFTSGWKTTADGESKGQPGLQKAASTLLLRPARCSNAAAQGDKPFNESQLLCAQVADPEISGYCQADSGGPLVCRNAVVDDRLSLEGLLAFHTACESGAIDVYIRVCQFADWMNDVMFGTGYSSSQQYDFKL